MPMSKPGLRGVQGGHGHRVSIYLGASDLSIIGYNTA